MKLLNFHNAEYLLIGGFAVGYHGYPRATGDMDIWTLAYHGAPRYTGDIDIFVRPDAEYCLITDRFICNINLDMDIAGGN